MIESTDLQRIDTDVSLIDIRPISFQRVRSILFVPSADKVIGNKLINLIIEIFDIFMNFIVNNFLKKIPFEF
jgi:hypothetical protein